ncbi:ribosomal protein L11, isoform CRA_a [Rattus norvegicus]|uniref:Ribosomal protein L11, isoform CRA_a n=1 Tax=Rattus norvegicus TaxID=10116 RepID=A6IT95_RAT|nr:ribosomal protein L11, isoform CRA_a [Rattus norvegicus]
MCESCLSTGDPALGWLDDCWLFWHRCWVGQVSASQTRSAEQAALGPNTESAKRRPCAGSSRR